MLWQLALLLVAITYMVGNFVALYVNMKMLQKMDGVFTKSVNIMDKMLDMSEKAFDDMFDDK